MNKKQLFGYIGSIVLLIGVFTPIVSLPMVGNMDYFQNGEGDGVLILILAIISLVIVFFKKYKGLWLTSILSLILMFLSLSNFYSKIAEMKAQMESELENNPFRGLADMAMESVQLQWGWIVMFIGVGLLIASIIIKDDLSENR